MNNTHDSRTRGQKGHRTQSAFHNAAARTGALKLAGLRGKFGEQKNSGYVKRARVKRELESQNQYNTGQSTTEKNSDDGTEVGNFYQTQRHPEEHSTG